MSGPAPHGITTVALIEDDRVYRTLIEEIAHRSGRFAVIGTFENAATALTALGRQPVDIAIVDVGLPGASGIDVVRRLRDHSPNTRCVMLTAADDVETLFAALEAGASGYL